MSRRAFLLMLSGACLCGANAHAENDRIPIPPKRPSVLMASKAYIEELRARAGLPPADAQAEAENAPEGNINKSSSEEPNEEIVDQQTTLKMTEPDEPPSEAIATPAPAIEPATPIRPETTSGDELIDALKTPTREDILKALNEEEIPTPQKSVQKLTAKAPEISPEKLAAIESAAGTEEHIQANEETDPAEEKGPKTSKLVSFYLQPNQIKLDEAMISFLQNHALRILKEDSNMEIEIHTFATVVNNEKYSDVRLSLARALEVRTFLINHNVDPARLKLKSMSDQPDAEADDRIDLMFFKDL